MIVVSGGFEESHDIKVSILCLWSSTRGVEDEEFCVDATDEWFGSSSGGDNDDGS